MIIITLGHWFRVLLFKSSQFIHHQNDHFYDSLNHVASTYLVKKAVPIAGDFNGHVAGSIEDCEDHT